MKKLEWDDETIVEWLQLYPNVKKRLVEILVRRYKNLIYKEIAKQCDQRYDREEIIQQIVYLFIQLLEEYDGSRGIPLAGFLKIKLPNRIYNYFKTQVKVWTAEIPHDGLLVLRDDEDDDSFEIYEIGSTTMEIYDFWVGISRIMGKEAFEALFLKFECEYGTDEISVLMRLRGPCDAEKLLNNVLDGLRYDERVFAGITFDPSQKHGTSSKAFKKETVDMTYHIFQVLHQEVSDYCGVFNHGFKTLKQMKIMSRIYAKGRDEIYQAIDELVDFVTYQCGCATARDILDLKCARDIC